jgi:hypothetical protein
MAIKHREKGIVILNFRQKEQISQSEISGSHGSKYEV